MTPDSLSIPLAAAPGRPLLDRPRLLLLLPVAGLAAFCLHQNGIADVVRRLVLPDTDDAMRLVGVRDLLAGQPWFDNLQHRLLPPSGAPMHWSRLVDLPLAAGIGGLTPLLGRGLAEGLVAALWPPALFLAYLAVLWAGTRRLFGFEAACFAVLCATQLPLSGLFGAGRIDHHNIQALAMLIVALGIADPGGRPRMAMIAGIAAAFSLAVGLETLPFVAVLGVAAVLRWMFDAEEGGPALESFGGALALASLAFFAAQTAPSLWGVAECDALSAPWLLLSCGGGLGSVGLSRLSGRLPTRPARLFAAFALGLLLAGSFVWHAPQCAAGPFALMPAEIRAGWLDRVMEVMPLWRLAATNPAGAVLVGAPLAFAFAAAIVGTLRHEGEPRRMFAVFVAFLALGGAITLVHLRGSYIASALVPVMGGWVFASALRARSGSKQAGGFACAILFLGYIMATPVLLAQERLGFRPDVVRQQGPKDCASPESLAVLDALPPGLVLAPVDLGPSLLLHTRHAIVAGPYHRAWEGILAGLALERGTGEELRRAIGRHRPDYVALCAAWVKDDVQPAAASRALLAGERIGGLDSLHSGSVADLRIWRVRPDDLASLRLRP